MCKEFLLLTGIGLQKVIKMILVKQRIIGYDQAIYLFKQMIVAEIPALDQWVSDLKTVR